LKFVIGGNMVDGIPVRGCRESTERIKYMELPSSSLAGERKHGGASATKTAALDNATRNAGGDYFIGDEKHFGS
jgi:hypothetical protein